MGLISLGRLQRVDVREVFANEPVSFTPWLARGENLQLLGETIGMELELEAQEKEVGPFRADILCKNIATDEWVLIENQLGKTDHIHLGQLLTYAAGLDAVTIVWIAHLFTDEHRAALDWLNTKTAEGIRFFGLEIELWRIGNSEVAPKFNIRSQPNEWSADVRTAADQTVAESEHKQLQLRFWTAFRQYMEESNSTVKCQKASPQHWMTHSIGKVGFHLASIISSGKGSSGATGPELRVELIIDGQKRYSAIASNKERIETAFGGPLCWYNPPENTQCRVFIRKPCDFSDDSAWPAQQAWLRATLERFRDVFAPIIQNLDHSGFKE